jgi:hypothetical protein
MQLSVLSALARRNVDPWEEAARLAAMPKAIVGRTLVSTLDSVPGRGWNPSETEVIAARLVQLLPHQGEDETIAPTDASRVGTQRTYWLVWLGFALALSLLSPRHQATTTNAGGSTSNATSQSESGSVRHRESNVAHNRRAKGINTRASVRRKPRSRETWLPQVSAMIEPRPNLHRSWYDYNWDLALTSLLALVLLAGIVLWANVH